ncbi:MAG: Zn-ribbon-containing RNA-binding protein [Labilithrix sp.]|nr:Zn-ribbon-containing RNA-binding protein [Labilithrix sp.]
MENLLERAGEDRFAKKRSPIPMAAWKIAVGPRIADRAQPVSLERGVLLVKVTSSVWANELQMLAPELVARLRVRGYGVDQLRFRVGPLDSPERPPERRATRIVPPPVQLDDHLKEMIAMVPDPALAAIITQAARANLAWQDFVAPAPEPISEAPRGARVPRDAGTGTVRPGHSAGGSGAASPRSREGDSGRRR